MANILVYTPDHIEEAGGRTRNEFCSQLFYALKDQLEDELDISDAYIVDFQNPDADHYLLGQFEPEQLLDAVRSWNQDIILSFAASISTIEERAHKHGLTILEALARNDELKVLDTDTPETYALRQSTCAIDNHFTTFGQCMNYLPTPCGYSYARTLIQPEELSKIEAKPEDYAIISGCVK